MDDNAGDGADSAEDSESSPLSIITTSMVLPEQFLIQDIHVDIILRSFKCSIGERQVTVVTLYLLPTSTNNLEVI